MSRSSSAIVWCALALALIVSAVAGCKGEPDRAPASPADHDVDTDAEEREARDGGAAPTRPADADVAPRDADARQRPSDASGGPRPKPEPGAMPVDAGDAQPEPPARDASGEPAADAGSAEVATCTASSSLRTGDNRATLQHQGRSRSYIVYVPGGLDAKAAAPLVLDFHGNGGSAMQQEGSSGWREKADQEKFLVAYPDGVGKAWNVGNCCGEALSANVDDVGFARALITEVSRAACVDAKRVYATGLSNGAGLAHRIACEAADLVAAIAAASADLVTDPCTPARPISELSVRGTRDTLVAYEGGNTGSTGWYSPGAKGTLELWKNINGCTGTPATKHEYCETYTQCKAGVEIALCSLPGAGHILYRNSLDFSVPEVAWEMFERQRLP